MNKLISLRESIATFVFDALRDQDTMQGCRIEVSKATRKDVQVKIWSRPDGPPEYFTVSVTHNQ